MAPVLHCGLLALSIAAVGGAGARVSWLLGARRLEWLLATVALTAAAAVVMAVALGLVELGGSAVALTLAALVTWAAARAWRAGEAVPGLLSSVVRGFLVLPGAQRRAVAAAFGAWAGFVAWQLVEPALGFDAVLYHLPESVAWVQAGDPGLGKEAIVEPLAVGAYPVAAEVLVAWAGALASSPIAITLLGCLVIGLVPLASWTGLRALAVPRAAAAAGAAALGCLPAVLVTLSSGWTTDAMALAWLLVCGALCAGARAEPRLFVVALIAGGLAIGTKTTAVPLTCLLLLVTAVAHRRALRPHWLALAAAGVVALAVGATWYVRTLIEHGSPLWPFVTTPWSDPRPPVYAIADVSFIDRPGATLERLGDYYLRTFASGAILLVAAVLAPLVARRRAVLAAAGATVLGALLWANAPATGVIGEGGLDVGTGDTTRYMIPALAAAVLTIGLAARERGVVRVLAVLVLVAAAVIGAIQSRNVGELVPVPAALVLGAALAGALVGDLVGRVRLDVSRPRLLAPAVVGVAFAVVVGLAANGWVERHLETEPYFLSGTAVRAMATDPRFEDGSEPVATTFSQIAVLAGDRLQHPLELIRSDERCAQLRERRARGWLVVSLQRTGRPVVAGISRCLGPASLRDADYAIWAPAA